jgi:hypothetical protein
MDTHTHTHIHTHTHTHVHIQREREILERETTDEAHPCARFILSYLKGNV